jgi:integrase
LDLNILPELGKRKLANLTRADIETFLATVQAKAASRPNGKDGIASFNQCRTVLSSIYSHAIKKLDMDIINRVLAIDPIKAKVRQRTFSDPELKVIWSALATVEQKSISANNARALQFQLLTLQRSGEVAAMQWSELDLNTNYPTWTIPEEKYKTKQAMVVPLSK